MASKNSDGTWSAPIDLGPAINDHTEGAQSDNPFLTPDGGHLYFTSNRPGGQGGKDIWTSTKTNGVWSAPTNLGAPINTSGDEDQFWMSANGRDIYWNGPQGIMHCSGNGSNCTGAPEVVHIPGCTYPAEVSLPDDGKTMYFACVSADVSSITIMYTTKQSDGSWGQATPVD